MSLETLEITLLVEVLVFTLWRLQQDFLRRVAPRKSDESHNRLRRQLSRRVPVLL